MDVPWEMCIRDRTVIINKTPFYGGRVHLAPINSLLPEIDKDLTQKEEQVLSVYNGNYRLTLSGNWYQSTDFTVTIDNRTNRFELEPCLLYTSRLEKVMECFKR